MTTSDAATKAPPRKRWTGNPRDPVTLLAKAKSRRQAHEMLREGASIRGITRQLEISRSTCQDWLDRPCPTDDEIALLEEQARTLPRTPGGLIPLRAHLSETTNNRLIAEATRQGTSRTRVVECSLRLYLDAMAKLRGEIEGPLEVRGYRP